MKMNLSVVMSIKDKTKAPLKGMADGSDHYAKAIKKVQDLQADNASALGMIDAFKNTRTAMDRNAMAMDAAKEKLDQLNASAAKAKQPSAALTEKIAKQQQRLAKLSATQDGYKDNLVGLGKQLTKAGVKMYDLDGESDRLNQSYKDHGTQITKLSKKYTTLQRAIAPVGKLNRAIKMPTINGVKNTTMAGAGLLGSMAGFGLVVGETANQLDEMARVAGDLKMPVSELQALRLQAIMAGAESESMDAALGEMMLRWGEMKTLQSGAMNDYFEDTGNRKAYEDLMNAKDVSEAYQVLLREIAAETDESKQKFMADEFFGSDSENMLKALKSGTDGYKKAKQQLNDSGGPVDNEAIENATAYSEVMKKMGAIVESLKFSALTPVMGELASIMGELTEKMKNMDWREGAIAKLRDIVSGTFNAFKFLGNGLMFVAENFREIVAMVALAKIGLIALNAVIMANPIGLIVAGVMAAVVAITYLVDKFVGLDKVMTCIGEAISKLWEQFKKLINMLPDALIPDGWKTSAEDANEEVKKLAKSMEAIKDKNATLGFTTEENTNLKTTEQADTTATYRGYQSGPLTSGGYGAYRPLTQQTVSSKSEVALTIKSDTPVKVDEANSEKGTDLNVDVGNLAWSY